MVTAGVGGSSLGCRPQGSVEPAPLPQEPVAPRFVPGDRLELRVYDEPELSGEFQVQADGSIDVPLVGAIGAQGKTQSELARAVEAALADGYLRDPQVTVVVLERQNLEVSVLGAVGSPGRMPFVENLTLVQAISAAGGLTPLAAPRRVRLTRPGPDGPSTIEVSVKDITEGRKPDMPLRAGDLIFVPESPI